MQLFLPPPPEPITPEDVQQDFMGIEVPDLTEEDITEPDPKPVLIESRAPLFFDIETIPDFGRSHLFHLAKPEPMPRCSIEEMPDVSTYIAMGIDEAKEALLAKAPSDQWLDGLARNEKKGKNRTGYLKMIDQVRRHFRLDHEQEMRWLKQLSTTPEYCKIIALGWKVGAGPVQSMVEGTDGDTEESILHQFWNLVACHSPVVGYNIEHFDLRVLGFRSALHRLSGTRYLDTSPYRGQVKDLYKLRYPRGHVPNVDPGGLKAQAKMLGIEVPAGDMDGSQVWDTYQKNPEDIHTYVQSDVWVLYEYYCRLQNLYW